MTLLELDWTPLWLTFRLAALTTAILLVIGLPLAAWLAGPLLPVLRDACAGDRLARGGLFNPVRVRMLFDEHIARRADHGRALWSLLVFQLWMSRYESGTV